jgi:hypothetical protein
VPHRALLKSPQNRAPDMGHWRAIKQGERRSFTVFPGQAPKAGNALVRTPSATFQAGHASSILVTRSTAKAQHSVPDVECVHADPRPQRPGGAGQARRAAAEPPSTCPTLGPRQCQGLPAVLLPLTYRGPRAETHDPSDLQPHGPGAGKTKPWLPGSVNRRRPTAV